MMHPHLSCTWDRWGPLLASSMEMCSSSAWLRLRVEAFSSTMVQSPSTTELFSVRSVAEPMLYSSTEGGRRRKELEDGRCLSFPTPSQKVPSSIHFR